MKTTQERIDFVTRAIAEREALAGDLRKRFLEGANNGERLLTEARQCEAIAEGMKRAIAILFP